MSMMSPEAQTQLAKGLPIQTLQRILQGEPGPVDQYIAMSVLTQKMQAQTAMQGQMAAPEAAQPSLKDRLLQASADMQRQQQMEQMQQAQPENSGIGQLSADNMNSVVAMAEGGVVGFSGEDGSLVRGRYGMSSAADPYANGRYGASGAAAGGSDSPFWRFINTFGGLASPRDTWSQQKANEAARLRGARLPYPEAGYPTTVSQPEAKEFSPNNSTGLLTSPHDAYQGENTLVREPTEADVAAKPTARRVGAAVGRSEKVPAQAAGIAQLPMAYPPRQRAEFRADLPTSYEAQDYSKILERLQGMTDPEMNEITSLIKQQRAAAEGNKGKRLDEARALAALAAAEKLMQRGKGKYAPIGEALGVAGLRGAEYVKEERAIEKEKDAADIALAQAKLAVKQGNMKAASDMFQHSEKLALTYAQHEADKEYKRVDSILKQQGLDDKERQARAEEAATQRKLDIMERHNRDWARIMGASVSAKAAPKGMNEYQYGMLVDKANDNAMKATDSEIKVMKLQQDPRFKGMTALEIRKALADAELRGMLARATGGISALPAGNPAWGEGAAPSSNVRPW